MENKKVSCMYAIPLIPLHCEKGLEELDEIEIKLHHNIGFKILELHKTEHRLDVRIFYKDSEYNLSISITDFSSEKLKDFMYNHIFTENEKEFIKKAKNAVLTEMVCNGNPLNSYHLQIKIIAEILHKNLIAVYDSNSINVLSGRWVEHAAKSSVPPCPLYAFSIHAVPDKKGDFIWLHTHGLSRYGLNELDILDSKPDFCIEHSHLLQNLALNLICGADKNCAYIGILQDHTPIICSLVMYKDALNYYQNNNVAIPEALSPDNKHTDDSHLAVFLFTSAAEYKEKHYRQISVFEKKRFENPIYFISETEMHRRKILAEERFGFVKSHFEKKASSVLIKISIPVDKEFYSEENKIEYIWFELQKIAETELTLKSIQDAYYVEGIEKETVTKYNIEYMSDWIIYTGKEMITPDDVYRL
ncbi:DUF4026 domain-containing protein [Treponema sp. OMZ 787]|uniref:DUF4026 domain-containing protein n=1 Tax=Treponema sp. OMZ 787 TaxID=2563669 RepID=UPI0020A2A1E5|nr:DUF4026 domain-containing protein [Treponema sp. OMZ 787]UTC61649.1 DUF4026 domain-containing protein [Treponema sp. OMZ 787]